MLSPEVHLMTMGTLADLYQQGKPMEPATLTAHYQALSDLTDAVFLEACRLAIRSEEFMPKPATIIKYADQVARDHTRAVRLALPAPEPPPPSRAAAISWDDVAYDDLSGGVHAPAGIEKIAGLLMPPNVAAERAAAYERARQRIQWEQDQAEQEATGG